ncbi:MAG: hypothetical protein ACNS61_11915, partial [Candidatus Wenzhouxiangella sp. M2_3B_020]
AFEAPGTFSSGDFVMHGSGRVFRPLCALRRRENSCGSGEFAATIVMTVVMHRPGRVPARIL